MSDDALTEALLLKLMGFKARSDEAAAACPHMNDVHGNGIGPWYHFDCPANTTAPRGHFGFRCSVCGIWFCERCEAVYRKP